MAILESLGRFPTLNERAVMAMFLTFIFLLFRGIPVAFALVGVSLIFILIAEIFPDPHRQRRNAGHSHSARDHAGDLVGPAGHFTGRPVHESAVSRAEPRGALHRGLRGVRADQFEIHAGDCPRLPAVDRPGQGPNAGAGAGLAPVGRPGQPDLAARLSLSGRHALLMRAPNAGKFVTGRAPVVDGGHPVCQF